MDIFEQIQQYISNQKYGSEILIILLGAFFIWSAIANWNWIYDPPYNSAKNPIGYWFGRNAFRLTIFIFGVILIGLSIFIVTIS